MTKVRAMNLSATKRATELAKTSVRATQERLEILKAQIRSHQGDEEVLGYIEPLDRAAELTAQLLRILKTYTESSK